MTRFPDGSMVSGSLAALALIAGCNYRHSAPITSSDLPPPPGDKVMHATPVIVDIADATDDSQCVAYEGHRTLCFHGIRKALGKSLTQGLWPAFPGVRLGRLQDAKPGEYVLQVEAQLEALPPDENGPGWSAGIQGRWRVLRDGQVLAEEVLASRSRAEFPYGAALGVGGTEVVDAFGTYVVTAVSQVEESQPLSPRPLPAVIARAIPVSPEAAPTSNGSPKAEPDPSPHKDSPAPANASLQAKTSAP